ncbi:IS1380 family transposase [Brevibacterium picturae]|uniref:IS1380-like element ISMsm3 family transposase n=1 Tax=Brevibacterium picturae TaxID=260553 RepID=A0ABP4MZX9_9MICO
MGECSGWTAGLVVSGDGKNLVSHAGTAALRMLADQVGLTRNLSTVLAQPRLLVHDRGRVLVDLGVSIADGAEVISGIDAVGESSQLYGPVASVSTTWRALGEIAAAGQAGRRRIARAVAKTRAHVWDLIAGRHGELPPIRVADREITGMVGIRIDATLITAHSEKELASPNWKKGFGFHPLLGYCDNTNEPLAQMLRTGRAGSNTAKDHLRILDEAIGAVPAKYRRRLLISVDGAGASHDLIGHLDALANRPGRQVWWTVGWDLGQRERTAITLVPEDVWQVAIDTAGEPRTSRDEAGEIVDAAQVADITDLIRAGSSLTGWPTDMRILARRERPHPGAQLSLFEQHAGWRYQLTATNIAARLPAGHANAAVVNNLAYLDALARSHARVEDRIRTGKSCGLAKFPSHDFDRNTAWLDTASIAQTLLAWFAHLSLDGDLARAEPNTIRYRLLHVAARLTRGQRRRYLRIDQTWPWTPDLVTAIRRIQALPAGP